MIININNDMNIIHTELSKEIAIEENLFMHDNVLYERMYNHRCEVTNQELKYRFFTENDYDYTNILEHKLTISDREMSILHRALKVYHIDLLNNNLINYLDYPDALESIKLKIKYAYENN